VLAEAVAARQGFSIPQKASSSIAKSWRVAARPDGLIPHNPIVKNKRRYRRLRFFQAIP
jgi:hypothetical protein